jgi:serine/threonine protein kinase
MPDLFERLTAAIGRSYRIERELGQGGMATVYLAEDLKHHRKVALKVLRPELAATMGPERFAREIEVAARLQHPHILGLLDSGDVDGFFYYVMPYVEGETLRDRLARSGELPVHEAVRLRARSPTRWRWRTGLAWSTAISSPRTSSSPAGTRW